MDEKLTRALQLRLSDQDLADLDAYCAAQRRKTGENLPRQQVIRQAIRLLVLTMERSEAA